MYVQRRQITLIKVFLARQESEAFSWGREDWSGCMNKKVTVELIMGIFDACLVYRRTETDLVSICLRHLRPVVCCHRSKPLTNKLPWLAGGVHSGETQIRLCIIIVWSKFSMSTWRNFGSEATCTQVPSKDSGQTAWMCRLIWVFAGKWTDAVL